MIPQGLRWQLPLSVGENDTFDNMAWEELLNHCSMNVIEFIIDLRKKEIYKNNRGYRKVEDKTGAL